MKRIWESNQRISNLGVWDAIHCLMSFIFLWADIGAVVYALGNRY
jgi:hypothetical protein